MVEKLAQLAGLYAHQRIVAGIETRRPAEHVDADAVALEMGGFAGKLVFYDIGEKRAQPLGTGEGFAGNDGMKRAPHEIARRPVGPAHGVATEEAIVAA